MKTSSSSTGLMIIAIMIATIALSACKKDENNSTKTDILSKGTWKVTALTVDPGFPNFDENYNIIGYSTDMYSSMDACSKDDTFKFNSDNTIKFDENTSKCDPSDPQTSNGTWSFKTNETILSITDDSAATTDYTILTLSDSALVIKYSETDGSVTYTFTITFSH